jgi:hypothetical protein
VGNTRFTANGLIIGPTVGGADFLTLNQSNSGNFNLRSGGLVGWTASATNSSTTLDTALARNAAGVLEVNNGTAGQFGALKAGTRDAGTNTMTDGLILGHQSTGVPNGALGESILFNLDTTTTAQQLAGRFGVAWNSAAQASRDGYFSFWLIQSALGPAEVARIYSSGGMVITGSVQRVNPGAGILDLSGIKFEGAAPANGKLIQSNGTSFQTSNLTWPTAAGTAGQLVQSTGVNMALSTPTWPSAAGTAGYSVRSDGTNFASYPMQIINSSTASQSPSTSDVYLTGSNCVVAAGDFKAKGQYRCIFDMTKSAGTGAIVISLRVGTAGAIGDPAVVTFTFGAGTSVADSGIFEVIANWRSVGSGTSAVVQGICRGTHNLATTGLFNNAAGFVIVGTTSSGFASNTATNIGVSFNGSTAFAGTTTLVQASLQQ